MKIWFCPLLLLPLCACSKNTSDEPNIDSSSSNSQAAISAPAANQAPDAPASTASRPVRPSVNPFDLDTSLFYPVGLVVGLETYIDAKSPILNYTLPKQADYVEIIRCDNKTVIETGLESTSIQNLSLSLLPQSEKDALYRNNDYFGLALSNKDCVQLSLATTESTFSDTYSPSGSWFYLVRACVNPGRLLNVGNASNRNCSRQVSISAPLLDYKNLRDDKINNALRQERLAVIGITSIARKICESAETYANALDTCAITEQDRAAAKKKRDAMAQLIGSGIEFGIAILTMSGGIGIGTIIHFMFLSGSFVFSVILKNILSNAKDMPRVCTEADIDGTNRIKALMSELAYKKDLQIFWQTQIDNAKNGNNVISSPNFQVPDYKKQLEEVLQARSKI